MPASQVIYSVGDVEKVLPELACEVFVSRILASQFHGDGQQVQAVHAHPARAVRLFEMAACGERRRAVEYPDVVQAQKTALEHVHALGILTVYPPGEIQHQLVKHGLQELPITLAAEPFLDLVHAPGSPRVYWRIDVSKRPLIGR